MKGHKNIGNPFPNTIKFFLIFFIMVCFVLVSCRSGAVDDHEDNIASVQETTSSAEDIEETGLTGDSSDTANSSEDILDEESILKIEIFRDYIKDLSDPPIVNYTFQSNNGNKITSLKGDLPSAGFIDIELEGKPLWVVSGSVGRNSFWVIMLDDGSIQVFKIEPKDALKGSGKLKDRFTVKKITENISSFDSPAPPVILTTDNYFRILDSIFYNDNFFTHPVITGPPYYLTSLDMEGKLGLLGEQYNEYYLNALPDGRIISDNDGLIYLFTNPSTDYAHGILGDTYEASTVRVFDSTDDFKTVTRIDTSQDDVIESLYPIIYDLDQDGSNEIIVTLSNSSDGSRIAVFDLSGNLVAEGPPIGTGKRWRHQLAAGPFGPDGEIELVDVLTPHIGGIVEFYRLQDGRLNIVTKIKGYSSHQIGSRNLDMAIAGDFDNDGKIEVIVPDQSFTKLGIIKHSPKGAEIISNIDIGGKLSTNISVAEGSSENLILGVGREDGVLRIWITE